MNDKTQLVEHIKQSTQELRVVIPGTQALWGFQLNVIYSTGFEKGSDLVRYMHLSSIIFVATALILLMVPPAFHQIAEKGEFKKNVLRNTGRTMLAAMFFLAIGIGVDLWDVIYITTRSNILATSIASVFLLLTVFLWFVHPYLKRSPSL